MAAGAIGYTGVDALPPVVAGVTQELESVTNQLPSTKDQTAQTMAQLALRWRNATQIPAQVCVGFVTFWKQLWMRKCLIQCKSYR